MTEPRPLRILTTASGADAMTRDLSRRGFLSLSAMAGLGALITACAPGDARSGSESAASGAPLEGEVRLYTWAENDDPDVLATFTSSRGPSITMDYYSSDEEMIAKLIAAKGTGGYDLVSPSGTYIPQMVENGLLMPIDKSLVPNLAHLDPTVLGQVWDPGNEYSVCQNWGTTGFVYDTTVIHRDLVTWSDFIDAMQNEASGRTTLLDNPGEIAGVYFWANGIDWNTQDAADYAAFEKWALGTAAQHVGAFDSYPGSTSLPTGAFALMQAWNGDARRGILASGDPARWKWVLGAPRTELWMGNWCVAAGAPHPNAAHAFIDFVLEPENAVAQMEYTGYNTGTSDGEALANAAGFEMPELIFFTEEELATMSAGEITSVQERQIDIWSRMKAAAGR